MYRIDAQQSLVLIHVSRSGSMKNLGHDHVIASRDLEGYVLVSDDPSASLAELRVPLHALIVDQPEFRARFDLDPEVPASAIEGTTRNMQDKVLESVDYPWISIRAQFASVYDQPASISVSITLHGVTFEYLVPVDLEITQDQLTVSGRMTVSHQDFGLLPFSAAGGLLRVADDLELVFDIIADRQSTSDERSPNDALPSAPVSITE